MKPAAGPSAATPAPKGSIFAAGGCAVAALAIVLLLANPPSAQALLFEGGWGDGWFGAALLALVPLLILVQISLGELFARLCAIPEARAWPWLLWLCGSAIMSLLGVVLAAAGWIGPWVCGGLLVAGAFYAGLSCAARLIGSISAWFMLKGAGYEKPAFVAVRLGAVVALVLIGLRAATGELNDSDVVQFYWGWLNEVRHLGGVQLTPEMPLIQDFAAGRGNGIYLFCAGLAPGLVSHAVSAVFCVMLAIALRQLVLRCTEASRCGPLAADLASLVALCMLPGAVAFGKYHLQLAGWALGFTLVCLLIVSGPMATARSRRIMVLPLAIAIPVSLAQFEAFAVLVLLLAVAVAPDRRLAAIRLMPLLICGCAGAAGSLLANWLYLGIPELNPFQLFEHFIDAPRFGVWTSRLQQYDINYIQAGALTFNAGNGVSAWRELRSLLGAILLNRTPMLAGLAGLLGLAIAANLPALRRPPGRLLLLPLGAIIGYALYRASLATVFDDLAVAPVINRIVLVILASGVYLVAVRPLLDRSVRPFVLGLLGYWLICAGFVVVFHSGSMERLMRHADVIPIGLLFVALGQAIDRLSRRSLVLRAGKPTSVFRLRRSTAAPLLLAISMAVSWRAVASAWAVDPPSQLFAKTFGLQGRATGLTNPMAKFSRCEEIAASVPANARVLFLNAYTAMAYCNNAVLLPRAMVVAPHQSDYARELAGSAFADADQVEQTLRRLHIDYFLVLKGDAEFWASGLSAPFRPDQLARRFDLWEETPSFYILTWRGRGRPVAPKVLAAISEWRRIAIQLHGFMAQNEFVGQWRAMANLGADRPKYELGSRLDFTAQGWSALYADHGWYQADPDGTWTVGEVALLRLPLAQQANGTLRLRIEARPFLNREIPVRTVHLRAGASEVATWKFDHDAYQAREVDLPPGAATNGEIVLNFEIEHSVSAYALGLSPDWRPLGLSVRSLTIDPVGPPQQ